MHTLAAFLYWFFVGFAAGGTLILVALPVDSPAHLRRFFKYLVALSIVLFLSMLGLLAVFPGQNR